MSFACTTNPWSARAAATSSAQRPWLRWQHPERGLLAPHELLAVAEENGLIVPIGEWVLREACLRNKPWQQRGLAAIPFAVNLSHHQFSQDNLVEHICATLRETGLAHEFLELELTETIVMDRVEHSIRPLHALRELDVRLAIDDFSTGYSSLADLKRFPLDVLKIDRSFTADITADPNVSAIVGAITAMAKKMNLSVIAEGVETQQQLDLLVDQGCACVQGYFVSRALTLDAYEQFLLEWKGQPLRRDQSISAQRIEALCSEPSNNSGVLGQGLGGQGSGRDRTDSFVSFTGVTITSTITSVGAGGAPFDQFGLFGGRAEDYEIISSSSSVQVPVPATLSLFAFGVCGLRFGRRHPHASGAL